METQNGNRSVRKTKKAIRETFISLLEDKPIQAITVKEITDACDISRGTFYFHYQDVYALLEELESDIMAEINDALTVEVLDAYQTVFSIFSTLEKNMNFCLVLISKNCDISFLNKVKLLVKSRFEMLYKNCKFCISDKDKDILIAFIVNGFIGIAEAWLSDKSRESISMISKTTSDMILANFECVH